MENLTAAQAIDAVLSVMPLDTFVDDFAGRMEIVGEPNTLPPVQEEVQSLIIQNDEKKRPMISIKNIVILGVFVADTASRASRQPQIGETLIGNEFSLGPGGKGSNQAVAAALAGG